VPWQLTDDVDHFAEQVDDLLAGRPAENTIALTAIATLRSTPSRFTQPPLLGWSTGADGTCTGAVLRTPPYHLHLAVVPDGEIGPLAARLRAAGVTVPAVSGEASLVARFASTWTATEPLEVVTGRRSRLYVLGELAQPAPGPGGRARRAGVEDIDLADRWTLAFAAEAGGHVSTDELVRRRVQGGLLWLWEDPDGVVVSLAGRHAAAGGVARVGPVYTPPEHRRRGYGAAVTAACSAAALDEGATDVVLFTDLANPTSNSVYRRIGFVALADHTAVRFTSAPGGA
jgi:predicted GNAT family acetyltransferase